MMIPNDLSILRTPGFVMFSGTRGTVIFRRNVIVLMMDGQEEIYLNPAAMILAAVLEAIR